MRIVILGGALVLLAALVLRRRRRTEMRERQNKGSATERWEDEGGAIRGRPG